MGLSDQVGFAKLPAIIDPDDEEAAPEVYRLSERTKVALDLLNTSAALFVENTYVNVKAYGATGDGVTDDRLFICLALDALIAMGGGTLYFPRGTYIMSSRCAFISTAAPIRLLGDGISVTTLKSTQDPATIAAGDSHFFFFIGCTSVVEAERLTFDLNNILTVALNTQAIAFVASRLSQLTHVEIKNGKRIGVTFNQAVNWRVEHCIISKVFPEVPFMTVSAAVSAAGLVRLTLNSVANLSDNLWIIVSDIGGVTGARGKFAVFNKNAGANQIDLRNITLATLTNTASSTGAAGGLVRITIADPTTAVYNALSTVAGLTTSVAIAYLGVSVRDITDSGRKHLFSISSFVLGVSVTLDLAGTVWQASDWTGANGGIVSYSVPSVFGGAYTSGGLVGVANSYQTQAILSTGDSVVNPIRGRVLNNTLTGWGVLCDGGDIILDNNYISDFDYGAGIVIQANSHTYRATITNNYISNGYGQDINLTAALGIECWAPYSIIKGNHVFSNALGGISFGGKGSIVTENWIADNGTFLGNGQGLVAAWQLRPIGNIGTSYSVVKDNVIVDQSNAQATGYAETAGNPAVDMKLQDNVIFGAYTTTKYSLAASVVRTNFQGDIFEGSLFVLGGLIPANNSFNFNVFVSGLISAAAGYVQVTASTGGLLGCTLAGEVTAPNTVTVTVTNPTPAGIVIFNATYHVRVSQRYPL